MNKSIKKGLLVSLPLFASALASCGGSSAVSCVVYDSTVTYEETTKGDAEEYHALSYEALGGDEVMPIGGFYVPFSSGGSIDGTSIPDMLTEKVFKEIEDAGINTFVFSADKWASGADNVALKKALTLAGEHNIGTFVGSNWVTSQLGSHTTDVSLEDMTMKKDSDNPELSSLIDEISGKDTYKSFIGLLAADEPFEKEIDNIGVFNNAFKGCANSKNRDVYMNALSCWTGENNFYGYGNPMTYDAYMKLFMDTIHPSMLSATQYPFTSKDTEESQLTSLLFNPLAIYRHYSQQYNIPQWRMLQAGGQWNDEADWIDSVDPYPSEGELLFDVNISLAYGAKAIQYFPLIQPIHFAYQTGNTYDFTNRNGLIGADGSLTRWYFYAKRANEQIKAIDNVLMKSNNNGIIVHGDEATKYIVTDGDPMDSLISDGTYRQLTKVNGDDCVVGCFDYKGGTALYVVNYSRTEKANITLDFDKSDYRYTVTQRAQSEDFVGSTIPLRLDTGEGALIVLH